MPGTADSTVEQIRAALDAALDAPDGDVPIGAVVFGPDGAELARRIEGLV